MILQSGLWVMEMLPFLTNFSLFPPPQCGLQDAETLQFLIIFYSISCVIFLDETKALPTFYGLIALG